MLAFDLRITPFTRIPSPTSDVIQLAITRPATADTITLDVATKISPAASAALREKLIAAADAARDAGQTDVRIHLRPAGATPPRGWTSFAVDTAYIDI